jgi:hypothetical protein
MFFDKKEQAGAGRERILAAARAEREARQADRTQHESARTIQSFVRCRLARKRARGLIRTQWCKTFALHVVVCS